MQLDGGSVDGVLGESLRDRLTKPYTIARVASASERRVNEVE